MNEYDVMPNRAERFVIKIDDFKQSMGLWYSLFAQRILPFLLFILPVNVVLGRINRYLMTYYFPQVNLNGSILLVEWIAAMLAFLAFAVFLPKAATAVEFVLGFGYLFLAFRHHLFNSLLGYAVLIAMTIFLAFKLVFLAFEIVRLKAFAGDKKNNIERDESGRVVRATTDSIAFSENQQDESYELSESGKAVVAENELFFADNADDYELSESGKAAVADNELFFADNTDDYELSESGRAVVESNEEFFLANEVSNPDFLSSEVPTDDDFFFG